jgi:predicted O-linked N-acetylglucosamine transferase (SPINDLY family)
VEKAIALAHPRDELAVMKKHLRNNRYSLPLFNTTQFTGDLESLYKTVLARRA